MPKNATRKLLKWFCGSLVLLLVGIQFTLEGQHFRTKVFSADEDQCLDPSFMLYQREIELYNKLVDKFTKLSQYPVNSENDHRGLQDWMGGNYTLLATFPNSGTGLIAGNVGEITGTCPMSVYKTECNTANPREVCAELAPGIHNLHTHLCAKLKSPQIGLVKSHLNLQVICQGSTYKNEQKYWSDQLFWRTRPFKQALHVIRNPWDNLYARGNITSSKLCVRPDSYTTHLATKACEGLVVNSTNARGVWALAFANDTIRERLLHVIVENDLIGWLAWHHELSLLTKRQRLKTVFVRYEEVVDRPWETAEELARYVGYDDDELRLNWWAKWFFWRARRMFNKSPRCQHDFVPVRLPLYPQSLRLAMNERIEAYLNEENSTQWQEPFRQEKQQAAWSEALKKALHYCFKPG